MFEYAPCVMLETGSRSSNNQQLALTWLLRMFVMCHVPRALLASEEMYLAKAQCWTIKLDLLAITHM